MENTDGCWIVELRRLLVFVPALAAAGCGERTDGAQCGKGRDAPVPRIFRRIQRQSLGRGKGASLPTRPSRRANQASRRLSSRRAQAPPARPKPTNTSRRPRSSIVTDQLEEDGIARSDGPAGADRPDWIERSHSLQPPGRYHSGALISGARRRDERARICCIGRYACFETRSACIGALLNDRGGAAAEQVTQMRPLSKSCFHPLHSSQPAAMSYY